MFPSIEPFHKDYLPVSPIHQLYFEQVGNPNGIPVVFVHGGPGGGIFPNCRRFFDPKVYHIILFDQRGSGKSRPYAELTENTTPNLIADMEKLRQHVAVEQWVVFGGSWGSTLGLAYAIEHPDKVLGLVLRGIFLARQEELDWLYGPNGAAKLFPEAYKRFLKFLPEEQRLQPVESYYQILTTGEYSQQLKAAWEWDIWETSISQLIPYTRNWDDSDASEWEGSLAIARIETHYFVNQSFLPEENYLLEGARTLGHIPTYIVNGRYDVICPSYTALQLSEAMPHAKLTIITDAGHSSMEKSLSLALVNCMRQLKYDLKSHLM